jgi:signal peptidase I
MKNNKAYTIISNIVFTIFMITMVFLIFITAQSRLTGKEPTLLGYRLYVVDSGSMTPTLPINSIIIVKEQEPQEIKKGDIITYYGYDNTTRVTHRVAEVQKDGAFFITKGDANKTADPNPLKGEKLIGKVVLNIPYIGSILRFLSTPLGIALLLTGSILWLAIPKFLKKEEGNKNLQSKDGCI